MTMGKAIRLRRVTQRLKMFHRGATHCRGRRPGDKDGCLRSMAVGLARGTSRSKWTICSGERGRSEPIFAKVLQHKALSVSVSRNDALFDQSKCRRKDLD